MPSEREPNFTSAFADALGSALSQPPTGRYGMPPGISPAEVLGYVYALLHSPEYRRRYDTFLRQDFPRVPLPASSEVFRELARIGDELVAIHLLESPELGRSAVTYSGPKDPQVGRVGWSDDAVWLDAAAPKKGQATKVGTIGFIGVPEEVWDFRIGGYQVCEKWLKDRKGRTLSEDDIVHYQKIVIALSETIRIMEEIDDVIDAHGGWPGAFAAEAASPAHQAAAEESESYGASSAGSASQGGEECLPEEEPCDTLWTDSSQPRHKI